MKYSAEFRDPALARGLLAAIAETVAGYRGKMTLMEVCGTHTMAIYQHGIRALLPEGIRLISGPGCPVCVTPVGYVDHAIALARLPGTIVATFGDMVRVPGSSSTLLREKALGADVRIVYSPLDALTIAEHNRQQTVVFLGVGFETTAPTVAGSILEARRRGLDNYLVLAAHKTMPTPMAALASDPELQVDGYLCPAHVSAVIGANAYLPLAKKHRVPCVVTGFEPLDVLQGVLMLARQVVTGEARVENQYSRYVKPDGNPRARAILDEVFAPCDARWRGIGEISGSGLKIRTAFAYFDAARQLCVTVEEPVEHGGCLCGEILKGKVRPKECPLFRTVCTPEDPVGACMVSSEGTCAAEYKYGC
ncbi:hydrogenase maturation protein HypD [Desulfuromonas soudanensis]|uniref:Hydrogenase maturation protein HypD n=1 Tax=Desulfuromonas soudanensis TaxID=1603606 RepID=A0A0M5IWK0_9BACT|nr:hydrogenase formation protein HypD [Desulfuromonas soudanensis]ALC18036.1 hydrogenase maturation protein HypD [Desulfuromonas soudanensis]